MRADLETGLHDLDVQPVARRVDDGVESLERPREALPRRHRPDRLAEVVRDTAGSRLVTVDDPDFFDFRAAREIRGRHAAHAARAADDPDAHR